MILRSNGDGIGAEALILDATAGDVSFAASSLLAGGTARQSDIGIRVATAGRDLTLGTVVARGLFGATADHTASLPAMLATAGDIDMTGPIDVTTALSLATSAGNIALADVTVDGVGQALTLAAASGDITADALDATGAISIDAGLAVTLGAARSRDAGVLANGRTIGIGMATAAGSLDITSGNGALTLGTGTAGATATLAAHGGGVNLDTLSTANGSIMIATDAGIDGVSGAAPTSTITAGGAGSDLTISGFGAAKLGTVSAADAVTVAIGGIDAATVTATAGALALTARTGDLSADALMAGGSLALNATAGDLAVGTATVGGSAGLSANGDVSVVTSLAATGSATINAGRTAILDAVTVGGDASTLAITAADAVFTDRLSASTITIAHRTMGDFRLGSLATDGATPADGFDLSDVELDRLQANALTIRTDRGSIRFGNLTLSVDTGRSSVSFLAPKRIEVTGKVDAGDSAATRSILFGGPGGGRSDRLRIIATFDGTGGALLLGNAAATLRADRIAAGQQSGFLGDVDALGGDIVGLNIELLSNPRSTLYNATGQDRNGQRNGKAYMDGVKLFSAGTLAIDATDYALFQNTGAPGVNSGVDIAGQLRLAGDGDALGANAFAVFGTVNGVGDIETSLLGNPPLDVGNADRAATRINGCLVGGGGCIVTVISQPTVNVFDASRVDILKTPDTLQLQFDPLVGTNNESLFTGVGAIDTAVEPGECATRDEDGNCTPSEGDQ